MEQELSKISNKSTEDAIKLAERVNELENRINKALKFIDDMFDNGDDDKIIDNLLKLEEILKGDENDTTKC